ncbi:hypothetical protein ACFWV1_19090 [Streptomyces sp. NPDC058700]|uniref:hypothetical protein n=1 Tax=unclassified Streptomyces TaxID=2593676 RepID=UPI00365C8195
MPCECCAPTHEHHPPRSGAIRSAVADLLPDHTATEEAAVPELPVALDMPGEVAGFLRTTELEPAERAALDRAHSTGRWYGVG